MPTVPQIPGGEGAYGTNPLGGGAPSQTDLLMAAADMQQTGKLPKGKFPSPTKPHPQGKKLKVIK